MSIERDLEGWTIAFDLDGTLVDSAPDLIGTLNRMLAEYELPPVPMSSTRHLVGHGAMAMLRHGFMEAGAVWDEAHAPGLFDRFIEHYLVPLIYPEAITRETQIILAVLLVAGNLLIYALWARRGRRAAARR